MSQSKARSVDAVTAQLETMSALSVAAIAAHPELLEILGDALVPANDSERVAQPFGSPRQPLPDDAATRKQLDALTRTSPAPDALSSEEVARLLGLGSRQAVHARLAQGALLAVTIGKRGFRFPREQFVEEGRVVEGLAELQRLLGPGEPAWAWLDEPSDRLEATRPIELLRDGRTEQVLAAALAASQGDFV